MNEFTSVYRNHPQSSSMVHYSFLRVEAGRIFMYQKVNAYLSYKYDKQIRFLIARHYLKIAKFHKKNKARFRSWMAFIRLFVYDPKFVIERTKK